MEYKIQGKFEYQRLQALRDNQLLEDDELHVRIGLESIDAWLDAGLIEDITDGKDYPHFVLTQTGYEALTAFEAQQQAEATPHTPASVDGFLFGKDVDVKRLQAHELHDADGAPVEDKDARIRQLEALVEEAAQVIAPIVKFQNEATEWIESSGTGRKPLFGLHVRYAGDWEFLSGDMRAETLTNLFAFAAKLDAVLKK